MPAVLQSQLGPRLSLGVSAKPMTEVDSTVARAQAGDEAAFQELFLAHRDTVARVVYRIMGPTPELEDVVQDVFIHVYRSIGKFRGESKFSTWLYRLASNVTKMHLRKKRSRPRFADVPVPERSSEDDASPDHAAERSQRIEALYRLVHQLSEKKRVVLMLHDFEGLSAKEIADVVEAPVLTVRTRLFYARKELYAALAKEPALAEVMDQLMRNLPGKPKAKGNPARPRRSTGSR